LQGWKFVALLIKYCALAPIELYITLNDSNHSYKCQIKQQKTAWECTLYQENFIYDVIVGHSIIDVLIALAAVLDDLGHVSVITSTNVDLMYISILQSHILLNRSDRVLRQANNNGLA
jgi:hypothetical protein